MNCYLCDGPQLCVRRTKLRYGVSRNVLECANCGLVYLEPKSSESGEALGKYYSEDYRKTYSPVLGQTLSHQEVFDSHLPFQTVRVERLQPILNATSRVLDVGCSTGHFLAAVKEHVREVAGVEVNLDEAEFVKQHVRVPIYTKPVGDPEIPQKHFDLVTAFHVLEHVDDPIEFLRNAGRHLKTGGQLCIEVPNVEDALLSVHAIEEYADFWYREPHIFNFSQKTLLAVLEAAGFVGEVRTVQRYSLLNHLSWKLTRAPQKAMEDGMSEPVFVEANGGAGEAARAEINAWFQSIDREYRELLEKHGAGDSLLFVGKRKGE